MAISVRKRVLPPSVDGPARHGDEIAELVTESYRLRAPARLAASVDAPNAAGPRDR